MTRFPLRSGLFNRVTRVVHAVENIGFTSGPAKRYRWWAGDPVAGNRRPDARCCGWLNPGEEIYLYNGRALTLSAGKLQPLRRDIRMYFPGPIRLIDPRQTVGVHSV
ncbi:hypothetical protein KCP76_18425 [Salmonella enterica subsp. enterica serovar Weltevreden]|nr:hypothetical protein KCP76_18425 [Salmonella enterica subsp. enterica serovar Weltevreden]